MIGEYKGPKRIPLIIAYMTARLTRETREKLYKVYITDMLKGLGGAKGKRWLDMAYPDKVVPEKSADDIVNDLIKRGGLVAR